MRLTQEQRLVIREKVEQVAGEHVSVLLFGSRLNDHAKGGDVDLLVEFTEPVEAPAQMIARLSTRISRILHGRKVDILVTAPNLTLQPIHKIARQEGQPI